MMQLAGKLVQKALPLCFFATICSRLEGKILMDIFGGSGILFEVAGLHKKLSLNKPYYA